MHFTDQSLFQIAAVANPIDALSGGDERDEPPLPNYATGMTSISWTSATGQINFDTGGGPAPGPATGTLTLTLVPIAGGDDVITVSATNSSGVPISTQFQFRLTIATTVTLGVTKE